MSIVIVGAEKTAAQLVRRLGQGAYKEQAAA
jgi:hypothetical protein